MSESEEKSPYTPIAAIDTYSDASSEAASLTERSSVAPRDTSGAPLGTYTTESEDCPERETVMHIRSERDLTFDDSMPLDEIASLDITVECECDLSFLSEANNVTSLSIANGESCAGQEPAQSYVRSFDFLSKMKSLQTIEVYGVKGFSFSCFNELSDLSEVTFSACSLDEAPLLNPSVKKLALYGCYFSTELLSRSPEITDLSIDGIVDDFSFLKETDHLRSLSLTMTGFSDMENLSGCDHLTELTILSREGAQATPLENVEVFSDLKKLTVYRGSLSAEQKEVVALLLPDCEIKEYEIL